jgi:hypothetical protein
MIAGVYAISGNASTVVYGSYPYLHTSGLFDIISGSNGPCPGSPTYFCNAQAGYDGPTGLGTPNGATQSFARPESIENAAPVLNSLNWHPGPTKRLCAPAAPGYVTCFALVRTDKT